MIDLIAVVLVAAGIFGLIKMLVDRSMTKSLRESKNWLRKQRAEAESIRIQEIQSTRVAVTIALESMNVRLSILETRIGLVEERVEREPVGKSGRKFLEE